MTTPPNDDNSVQGPQPNASLHEPEIAKDIKNAKNYGIISIVCSVVSLFLGFLALPSLFCAIYGLRVSNKLAQAGIQQGNSKTLNIIATVCGSIAVVLWILGMALRSYLGL